MVILRVLLTIMLYLGTSQWSPSQGLEQSQMLHSLHRLSPYQSLTHRTIATFGMHLDKEESNLKVGTRIIFDATDGEIVDIYGEMSGGVTARKQIGQLDYMDLEYGEVNLLTHKIIGIDMVSRKPILEEIPTTESEDQRRIRELEDALLLQTDNEIGGIL